jgi:hypothetical protein
MAISSTHHSAGQFQLTLVPHTYQGALIQQRAADGYINATAMCKAAGKEWSSYYRSAGDFITALERSLQIRRDLIIQSIMTGTNDVRGTWVHPQVAINLATWLSGDFAVQVSQWVFDWMSGKGAPRAPAPLPFHLRRYLANQGNVPPGHFSVLTELTLCLIAPLEALGYRLPEKLWPDISSAKMFTPYMRARGVNTATLPKYWHVFEDARQPVQAIAWPETMLADFRRHFREEWLPKRAAAYFAERDTAALEHLPRLLSLPKAA